MSIFTNFVLGLWVYFSTKIFEVFPCIYSLVYSIFIVSGSAFTSLVHFEWCQCNEEGRAIVLLYSRVSNFARRDSNLTNVWILVLLSIAVGCMSLGKGWFLGSPFRSISLCIWFLCQCHSFGYYSFVVFFHIKYCLDFWLINQIICLFIHWESMWMRELSFYVC